jgi:hypothetical protein
MSILPGFPLFFPAVPAFSGEISFVGATFSAGSTISWPGGIAAGQLALMFDIAGNGSTTTPSSVTPSGFAAVEGVGSLTASSGAPLRVRYNAWRKTLAGGESTLTGMAGDFAFKMLAVFAKTGGTWGPADSPSHALVIAGVTANQTVTVPTAPSLVVSFDLGSADGSWSPVATGEVVDEDSGTKLSYGIQNVSPANVAVTRSSATSALTSFRIPLTP